MIVRASLSSTENSSLTFKVIEYLKGTGPSTITVTADPSLRNSSYDKREAVLFLSRESSGGVGVSGTSGSFVFTDSHYSDPGYTIDTLDPAWLPAEASNTSGTSGSTSSIVFITDSGSASRMSKETISLADLRAKITWVGGGENIAGYDNCVLGVLNYMHFHRNQEAYYGRPWIPPTFNEPLASGMGAGTVLYDYPPYHGDPGYGRFWLTGQDEGLFNVLIVDDNKSATDGYHKRLATARPLPKGVYKFRNHGTLYKYLPCNFTPAGGTGRGDWTVTVTAPAGTLHEAFFDPVTVGAAVKADAANGVLKPAAFTGVDGAPAAIQRIAYEAGAVTIAVTPVDALAGHVVDVIAMDGTISLSLSVADAASDAGGEILRWPAATAPWASGDTLMVRIRPAPAARGKR